MSHVREHVSAAALLRDACAVRGSAGLGCWLKKSFVSTGRNTKGAAMVKVTVSMYITSPYTLPASDTDEESRRFCVLGPS